MNRRERDAAPTSDRLPRALAIGAVGAAALTLTPAVSRFADDRFGVSGIFLRYAGIGLAYAVAIAAHLNQSRAGNRRAARSVQLQLSQLSLASVMIGGAFLATGWSKLSAGPKAVAMTMLIAPLASLAWARWLQLRAGVTVTSESDGVAGEPLATRVSVVGRPGTELSFAMMSALQPTWTDARPGESGTVAYRSARRGVFSHAAMAVRCHGPLDLALVQRNWLAELPRMVHIAPRPAAELDAATSSLLDQVSRAARDNEPLTPAGVRPYRDGDPMRLVHWPATARSGEPVVRLLEPAADVEVCLIVDLGPEPGPAAEDAASLAARVGFDLLGRGVQLRLVTFELDGPTWGTSTPPAAVDAVVSSEVEVGRRLARATAGAQLPRPSGVERAVLVSQRGVHLC